MAVVVPNFDGVKRYVEGGSLEDGIYQVTIDAKRAEQLESDDNGDYFTIEFRFDEGPCKDQYLALRVHINGRFAFRCDQLMKALNLKGKFDTVNDLHGKKVRIQTQTVERGGQLYTNVYKIFPAISSGVKIT